MTIPQFNTLLRRNIGENVWASRDRDGFVKVYERYPDGVFQIFVVRTMDKDKVQCEPMDIHAYQVIKRIRDRRWKRWGRSTNDMAKAQQLWINDIKSRHVSDSERPKPAGWEKWGRFERQRYNEQAIAIRQRRDLEEQARRDPEKFAYETANMRPH